MKHRSVVIGVSAIQQKGNFENLDETLLLMDHAVKAALSDSGNRLIKDYVDEIRIPLLILDVKFSLAVLETSISYPVIY